MSPGNTSTVAVGIVNYGAGNIGNVARAIKKLNFEHALLDDAEDLERFRPSLLLLPGVGAFRQAAERLSSSGWTKILRNWASEGKPLLGICVGMQLLCTQSSENGITAGLDLLEGDVEELSGVSIIPHMGWNEVSWRPETPPDFFSTSGEERSFYFVHSYAVSDSPHGIATTEVEGVPFCSALRNGNVAGFQFHPERSGPNGVAFLGRVVDFLNDRYAE